MTTDKKTLADVQPGGRVRLGDGLRPCPFCGHSDFDQWPCEYIDASGANVVRCARCHAAAPMKVWHALSAQPSPGGQEWPFVESPGQFTERLADAMREFDLLGAVRHVLVEKPPALAARQPVVVDLPESLHDRVEALREVAARQPVGEPVAWYYGFSDTGEAGPVTFGGNPGAEAIAWAERHGHTLHYLYAAPPAQAVDLWQFRYLAEWVQGGCNFLDCDPVKVDSACRDLLALIDSQAVGNG